MLHVSAKSDRFLPISSISHVRVDDKSVSAGDVNELRELSCYEIACLNLDVL